MSSAARPWMFVAFLAGSATMLLELTAPRLMQPWFGASTFVWTNVIGVILVSLAIGYNTGGRWAGCSGRSKRVGRLLLVAGVLAAATPFLFSMVASLLLPSPDSLAATNSARTQLQLASFVASILFFAPPVFLLGAITPQIVAIVSDEGVRAGRAAGSVFTYGTLGSLVGTFLPTYVLVPYMGTRGSFLVGAAILAIPGLVLLLKSGRRAVGMGLVLLCFGAVFYAAHERPLRAALDGESLLREIESPYQYLRIVEKPGELLLRIDEGVLEYHSATLEGQVLTGGRYYDYFGLLPGRFPEGQAISVAILGSGAGTMARIFDALWPGRFKSLVNVEIDPEVVSLEKRFGYESQKFGPTIEMDGRGFLSTCSDEFDILIVDAYARQVDIPFHMATVEFFTLAMSRLRPNGILALNVSALDVNQGVVQAILGTMHEAGFTTVNCTPVKDYPNLLIWSQIQGDAGWQSIPKPLEKVAQHWDRFTHNLGFADTGLVLSDDHAPMELLVRESLSGQAP